MIDEREAGYPVQAEAWDNKELILHQRSRAAVIPAIGVTELAARDLFYFCDAAWLKGQKRFKLASGVVDFFCNAKPLKHGVGRQLFDKLERCLPRVWLIAQDPVDMVFGILFPRTTILEMAEDKSR